MKEMIIKMNDYNIKYDIDVSVIVTFFNMEKFVYANLSSVISNSYNLMIELIIIDDFSTDTTREKINTFINNNKNSNKNAKFIKIFNNFNLGVSNSRNIGIEKSDGKYITFLDGDDILSKDSLILRYNLLEKSESSLVYGKYRKFYSDIINTNEVKITRNGSYSAMLKSNFIAIGSGMIKKSCLGDIRFRNIGSEDYLFWLEFLKNNGDVVFLDYTVFYYRIVKNSRSGNNSLKKLKIINEIYKIYKLLDYNKLISIYLTARYTIFRIFKNRLL